MELIPMGTLNKESLGFDGKPANQRQNDLVMSLNLLQQANLIQYQDTSNKVAVFGIDRSHHAKENGRPEITSALSTVLSHLITSHTSFEQDLKKRLIDIYTEMPSPLPTAIDPLSNKSDKATQRLLDSIIDLDAPDGMRTKLYEYQKRSIWKMLKRELCPGYILDPSLIPMKDENNSDYYIDYSTGLGVCRTPTRKWDDVRGGLLCEDMGTGKTCICLALILHTRHQFSVPPSPFTGVYMIPTLRDLAAASIKVHGIEYRRFEEQISASAYELLEEYPVFYHHIDNIQSSRAKSTTLEIYLSSATLVIVPANLVDQWCNEVNKAYFALKLLVLTSNDKVIPEVKILASYDMVLISQARFAREHEKGAYAAAKGKLPCCHRNYTICRCPPLRTISPLKQIRWKRVIVDEGHTMSADLSNHALLASKLHADRRWICTGTPTSNLANLVPSATSTWSDQSDLTRLSSLIFSFFQIHPYVDNKNLFLKEIRKPFIDHSTVSLPCISLTTLSSVKRLRHLLERLMTRNRPEDINQSVTLPPLFEKVVRLDLEYFQILSLNSQIALIQANAILTEREDQDYFFHPSNQKHLRQVIDNLNNGCFWYSGGGGSYATLIKGTLQQAKNGLEAHYSTDGGKYPPTDIALLKEVIHNLQLALSDPSWNTLIAAQDVGYFCQRPKVMQQEALIPSSSLSTGDDLGVCIMLAKQILRERQEQASLENQDPSLILSSTSSKLNYIVCQILYHHPNEKCIVFCQSPNTIYYIHEFLTLAKIRCLTYRSGMTQSERSSNIMTFNTSENVAAIIMDTKHAAFGIDLSSASRVYFVSPVWQTATMRQAVKRAHRIGQTRPVYIETLVIRDSFEEAILNRRSELDKEEPSMVHSKESGQGSNGRPHIKSNLSRKGTSMADDGKFRELIRHIDFMPVSYRRQDRPYPLLSDYVLDECEVMKDFKVPLSRNNFCEIQRYSMETEHYSDSNVQLSPIKFEDDSRCAQDEMAYEGDIDLDSTMKESTMIVHERFEIIDEEVVCKEDEKKELGLKKEQELEPTTRNTESRLSRFPPELVKRETSYEKEISNSKRVRFD
ncbi:hypothetical protein MVEG_11469 [Podila verticillata NRRL 6337]|uniref:Helicase C-terminal domain-containing protein n=1 Tax=Podila verticillata NRRL 6337 TaxID=1069443 RepID=A0A086TJY1_9FUNG|nr:hypothetical protein MVEG_11469 [Podila verticillata NRRL 6337]